VRHSRLRLAGVDLPKPLDQLLAQPEGFMAWGLPGIKVKDGRNDPHEDEQRVAAVRKLIGHQFDLMLDANMAWSADEALERRLSADDGSNNSGCTSTRSQPSRKMLPAIRGRRAS
jgi:L-alanine-DL-glutamate epimerase-like enolase superfamily enzyme